MKICSCSLGTRLGMKIFVMVNACIGYKIPCLRVALHYLQSYFSMVSCGMQKVTVSHTKHQHHKKLYHITSHTFTLDHIPSFCTASHTIICHHITSKHLPWSTISSNVVWCDPMFHHRVHLRVWDWRWGDYCGRFFQQSGTWVVVCEDVTGYPAESKSANA